MRATLRRLLIGDPLPTARLTHERITKFKGLAVFSSDALSSTAYATEEILIALIAAGTAALALSLPIAMAIATVLAIVAFSYYQTIHAYPSGGGAHIVDAVGVFLSFTLSQAGMVRHWWRLRTPGWTHSLIINGIGATATAIVLAVVIAAKFTSGAWIVILLIPADIWLMYRIYRHYEEVRGQLTLEGARMPEPIRRHKVVIPVAGVHVHTHHPLDGRLSMRMRVSCIVPAYNEAATIAGVVAAARACPEVDEVIAVSDGSTDATAPTAERAGADRVIVLSRNGGKGDAVLTGLQWAAGDVVLLLDADLRGLDADHLTELLRPVLDRRAEMAVALFADDQRHVLLRPLSGQRAIRRDLLTAEGLPGSGFGLEMALDRAARLRGERVTWVAWLGVHHRSKRQKYGTVNGLRLKVRASSDLLRQARPAGRRARSPSTQRRSPSMLLAMVVLVVLVAAVVSVFVAHPSHASTGGLPALPPPSAADRFLVVVAHPDDEVIGAGGLIAAARRNGAAVGVVVVTSGDSNRFSAAVLSHTLHPGAAQFMEEGRLRQEETREAMARLGVDARDVFFLGFPDRALDQVMRSRRPITSPFTHLDRAVYPGVVAPGTPYAGPALTALLAQIVARVRPTVIVTHTPFDRHPDHRAVTELVERVRGAIPVYAFLVHAPGFPRPLRLAMREPLAPPSNLAHSASWSWRRFDLTPQMEQSKFRAVDAYRSQLASPYLRLLLYSSVRTNEIFAVRER